MGGGWYLLVRQVELPAELGLVLSAQVGVSLEGRLQAADLLRREGRTGPPPRQRGLRRGGGAVCGGRRGKRVTPFAFVPRGLFLCPAAETGLWRKEGSR